MKFTAHNAATGEPLTPEYNDATAAEIDSAAQAALAAAPAFAAAEPERRALLLEAIADELTARGAAWVERAHLETGLPVARLEGERTRTTSQLRLFAALVREGSWIDARIDTALPDRKPLPRPDVRRCLIPLGPIAVFGASNFPFAFSVAGGDTASALAAGNPVVVKAHPAHPGTSDIAAEAIRAAVTKLQLPAGVFGLVHGASPDVSLQLVRHPAIRAVGFTGSTRAGRALFDAAAVRPVPIPVFSEMSSLNPLVILPGALEERGENIAEGVVNSSTLGVGQFCTKPGLILGQASSAWERFKQQVAAKAAGVGKGTMLHAGIESAFKQGIAGLSGVEWLHQGAANIAHVEAKNFLGRPDLAHEIFGPYTLLITTSNEAELTQVLAALEGQLTATLHASATELPKAATLIRQLEAKAGRLVLNSYPTGVEVCHAMHHGGPYPATSDVRFTSVGTAAILRWARPVCYQGFPDSALPAPLQDANPLRLQRLVNGHYTRDPVPRSP